MELKGKRVAITGASSGIGRELLRLLLQEGCRVAACARHVDGINEESGNLFLKTCDVSKKEELDAFFDFAMEKLGGIDLYIANAGFAYYEKLTNPDWEHIAAIMDTNFTGTVYAAEKMKQLHGSEPYNFAVTASAMGLLSLPGYALYSGVSSAFARILSSAFLVKIPAISLPSFFRCDRVMHRRVFIVPPDVICMKKATCRNFR